MKSLVLALVALICLQVACAIPDSVTTGPYRITFDLGLPHDAYTITEKDPVRTEDLSGSISTDYSVQIQNMTGMTQLVQISLNRKEQAGPIPTDFELGQIVKLGANQVPGVINIETATRPIDGTTGGIVSLDYPIMGDYYVKMYEIIYYPKSDLGHLMVTVVSSYPWDQSTLQLFKTFHIEKINTTA